MVRGDGGKNKEASVGLLTVLTLTEPWARNSKTKTFVSATWRFSSWNGSGRHQAAWNDQHSLHALRHSSDIWKFLLNEATLKSRVTCTKEETLPHYSHCWTHKTKHKILLQMILCHVGQSQKKSARFLLQMPEVTTSCRQQGTNNPTSSLLFITFPYLICFQMPHRERCQWVYLISWSITPDWKGSPAAPQSPGCLFRHALSNVSTQNCCSVSSYTC